jgi:hypothetical protein
MAKRQNGPLVQVIPGYVGRARTDASLLAFPSLATDTFDVPADTYRVPTATLAAAARIRKSAAAVQWAASPTTGTLAAQRRPAAGISTTATDVQNALYMAGMSFGLIVGTTLGLSITGMIGL